MDIGLTAKKALNLAWRYRATWLFGCILAITAHNALWLGLIHEDEQVIIGNRIVLPDSSIIYFPGEGLTIDFSSAGAPMIRIEGLEPGWYQDLTESFHLEDIRTFLIAIGVLLLMNSLLDILFHYTAKASLICMVDEHERCEKMVSIRRGFRLGWSKIGWRLFLIDLAIKAPLIVFFTLLFALVISPLFLFGLESIARSTVLIIIIILLVTLALCLFVLLAIAVATILSILKPVMYQACAVDGLGVIASIRQGINLVKTRFKRVISTWLVWFAIQLVWIAAVVPLFFILFPVLLFTILFGVVAGGLLTLPAMGIASLFVDKILAWVVGVIFAMPLFFIFAFSPIVFLRGLVEVLKSTLWTLSYREFRPLTSLAPKPAGELEPNSTGSVLDP